MTDTSRTLALVALIAVVIAALTLATSTRTETPQPDPIKWDEITPCMYACPVTRSS